MTIYIAMALWAYGALVTTFYASYVDNRDGTGSLLLGHELYRTHELWVLPVAMLIAWPTVAIYMIVIEINWKRLWKKD